ncbi:MAG: hypothetical protein M3370_13065 [Actinomycetota bacterium]|nr:hypothetical protein [Actinomycetota bacterium]
MATETATNKQASGESSHSVIGVAPLFAAVAAVGTGVAALNAVGVVGQMERNYGVPFFLAIGFAILGTLLSALVVSGLLGKDTDLVVLRTAADQGAAEAWEISRSAAASCQLPES